MEVVWPRPDFLGMDEHKVIINFMEAISAKVAQNLHCKNNIFHSLGLSFFLSFHLSLEMSVFYLL